MDKRFLEMARKIAAMTPKNVEQETYYNFAFGAFYALTRAKELGYASQNTTPGKSTRRAKAISLIAGRISRRGSNTCNGEWIAGYFYNDALLRTDVAYEHILRYRTGDRKANGPTLLKKALKSGIPEKLLVPSWTRVRDEVNDLKHRSWEFGEGPGIELDKAVQIVQDLISTVEWSLKHERQRSP